MTTWLAIAVLAAGAYGWKVLGLSIPSRILDRPAVRTTTALVPVALLAALTATQTMATGTHLTVDARLAGLTAAAVALILRAPFLVVLLAAVATTAAVRLIF